MVNEILTLRITPLFFHVSQHRHKGLLKGALSEKTAQHIRESESGIERVRFGTRPKVAGDQHITDNAGYTTH